MVLDHTLDAFRTRCEKAGFDVVWAFRVAWFNADVDEALRLPDFGREDALGIVIGNSRLLWSVFVEAMRRDPARASSPHPLDAYTEDALSDAVSACFREPSKLLFAHDVSSSPIAIQRIAAASGLAHLSPSHLSIHPSLGPWFALRAVLVVDAAGPLGERPRAPDPCTSCAKPCVPAFERALAVSGAHDVAPHWQAWAEVRAACPVARESRYDDEQLRYHYTKDRSILRKVVREP